LWERAAGRGAPAAAKAAANKRGVGGGSESGDRPRFEPLSALALELDCFRANADGDSALFSETSSDAKQKKKKKKKKRDDDESDDDDGLSALDDDEEGGRPKKKSKAPTGGSAAAAMLAAAAFGGGGSTYSDDASSVVSGTSSQRKKAAAKAAFPIKGIDCVGCALVKKIAPVEKFVLENIDRMAEESLWKMAALVYEREVREPRAREGVASPAWSWKDLRSHFLLHVSNDRIARVTTCRQLQTMRHCVEQRLIKVDAGEREIDKNTADLLLKIVKSESEQRNLLAGGGGGGGGKKQPGGSTVGDAK